ncbi:MAG: PH domain-containing protein [Ruminococcus sp.]|nr:PH domain-containing protein [Ruminococcus sp.]MDE6677901.1 PH domain-containing protein [Ruminococcus sp.]
MKNYLPDRSCLMTLRILIVCVSLILVMAVNYFITVRLLVILIGVIIGAGAFFLMFAYLPLFLKSIHYTVTDTEIIKSSGVVIKLHQSVQYSSIQYVNVITTPFSQYTGLNFIICFVYGGQLRLLFLNHTDAREILNKVEQKGDSKNCITNIP